MAAPGLTLVTPATGECLTLADAKLHLRVTHDADDADITAKLAAARAHVEFLTSKRLRPEVWRERFDARRRPDRCRDSVRLSYGPVTAVSVVETKSGDGGWEAVSSDDFEAVTDADPAEVRRVSGWGEVRVLYACGFATVPDDLRAAVLLVLGHLYECRQENTEKAMKALPMGVRALCAAHMNGEVD